MHASPWTVQLQRQAQRAMRRLPKDVLRRLAKGFADLEQDPTIGTKLKGFPLYKYRVGDWRIIYSIEKDLLIVLVIDIGPRGDIYRRLNR